MVVHSVASSGQARSDTFTVAYYTEVCFAHKTRTSLQAAQFNMLQRQADFNGRRCTRDTLDIELAIVQFSEALANNQAKTRALLLVNSTLELHISPDERDLLRRHPAPLISHGNHIKIAFG